VDDLLHFLELIII